MSTGPNTSGPAAAGQTATAVYAIELHAVYDRPGKHALFGLFHGTAKDCRAKLRELREEYKDAAGTIHMRWLKPVPPEALQCDPLPAPLCWMDEDGWVPAEKLQEGMEA